MTMSCEMVYNYLDILFVFWGGEKDMSGQELESAQKATAEILPIYVDSVEVNPFDRDTVKLAAEGDDKAFSQLFLNTYRYCLS